MKNTERNRKLVSCYLENHTLQEVGDRFGLTRERVRQILNAEGIKPRTWTYFVVPAPPKRTQTFSERFWGSADRNGPIHPELKTRCWLFTGNLYPNGYGRFASLGKTFYAHRLAYMLHHRKSPARWVLHRCDNPPCVNPDHLYDGTPKDNTRDRGERGRSAYIKDLDGFKAGIKAGWAERRATGVVHAPGAKLTVTNVADIKLALKRGHGQSQIARLFNVNRRTIGEIAHNRNWSWVRTAENFSLESPLLVLTSSTNCG